MPVSDKEKERDKAKSYVYRLLNIRLRSEQEVEAKLKLRSFSASVIGDTIDYFRDIQLIDDRQFARKWIESRLNRLFGANRIRYELQKKGISKNILAQELKQATSVFPEEEVVLKIAQEKAKKYKGVDPLKIKQRIYGYLARKGFSLPSILNAIKKI